MRIIIKLEKNKQNFNFVSLYNITLFQCIIISLTANINAYWDKTFSSTCQRLCRFYIPQEFIYKVSMLQIML